MNRKKKREKKSEAEVERIANFSRKQRRFDAFSRVQQTRLLLATWKSPMLALVINGKFEKYIQHDFDLFVAEHDDFSRYYKSDHADLANIRGSGEKMNCGRQSFPRRKTINRTVLNLFFLYFLSLPLSRL